MTNDQFPSPPTESGAGAREARSGDWLQIDNGVFSDVEVLVGSFVYLEQHTGAREKDRFIVAEPEAAVALARHILAALASDATTPSREGELRAAIEWVGEVVPERDQPSALVEMPWEQFNRMRELIGRRPIQPILERTNHAK